MKNLLSKIYFGLFFFIPIPLFIDFGRFELFFYSVREYNRLTDNPAIPLPIGALALSLVLVVGYFLSSVRPSYFKALLPISLLIRFYLFVILPLVLHAGFVAGLSGPRIVQLIMPLAFLSLFSFPVRMKDRKKVLKSVMCGAIVFFSLHFISVFVTSENPWSVNEFVEFSAIFDFLIYQSLVSYPGVLSLYLFLSLMLIYANKKIDVGLGFFLKKYLLVFSVMLLYLLAASGRRAFLVEFSSSLVIIALFSFLFFVSNKSVSKKFLFSYFSFYAVALIFCYVYFNTDLSLRVVTSIENNTFDSGRVNILGRAFAFFYENIGVLFFGAGGSGRVGFHNYVLDQVYRIGLIAFLFSYFFVAFLVVRFVKQFDYGTDYRFSRIALTGVLMSFLFLQSMINASISQPYYFVNFFVVILVAYFVVFSRSECENKVNRF